MEEAGLGRDWQPESWQDILDACAAIKEKCGDDVVPICMYSWYLHILRMLGQLLCSVHPAVSK